MNCVNIPHPAVVNYLDALNLYLEWNRVCIDLYLNWYKLYLPKE